MNESLSQRTQATKSYGAFPSYDLALLRCPAMPLDSMGNSPAFLFDRLTYGHPLGSFGYPQPLTTSEQKVVNGKKTVHTGIIVYLKFKSYYVAGIGRPDFQADAGPHKFVTYQLDSFAYGGHSGGPVFDKDGRVVAVMSLSYMHPQRGYEVSYCDAVALENIHKELLNAVGSA